MHKVRFAVALLLTLVCGALARLDAGTDAPPSFKLAFYNIKSGFGQIGLSGVPRTFADGPNCTDTAQPLNAWGVGAVQTELRTLAADPAVVALGLAEAWTCARPEAVRNVLGWKAVTGERNGVAMVARYGFAGPESWTQLDTSRNLNPADTMWVLAVPVCLDATCSRAMTVFTAHWYSAGLPDALVLDIYETQARQTIAFTGKMPPLEPHVLLGDLNAFTGTSRVCEQFPKNSAIAILSNAGYLDAWTLAHPGESGYTGMWNRPGCGSPAGALWKRIDYAWSRNLRPISMTRFGMVEPGHDAASDHVGIVVEYPMPSASGAPTAPTPVAPTAPMPVAPWPTAPPPSGPTAPPSLEPGITLNRAALYFGSANAGSLLTEPQSVGVQASNLPAGTSWTVATDQPWLLAAKSATGRSVMVSVRPGTSLSGTRTGVVTVAAGGIVRPVPVSLTSYTGTTSTLGTMDTPADGARDVAGSIAVTGWAVHAIGVQRVDVYRDGIAGESSPKELIFIGKAVQVEGARPDLEAVAPLPFNYRAGWGLMVLTNMLPNQGNGTFTFHAIATAADGTTTELGRRTIDCSNAAALLPFGAIDTPGQGETVSGTVLNWGWALAPRPSSIRADGSGIEVYVDGVNLGHPAYNLNRADIAGAFPGLSNTAGAVGVLPIDTTRLADGVHTIAWFVRDETGHAEGIGSRYFTVLNAASATGTATVRRTPGITGAAAADAPAIVHARTGFERAAPLQEVPAQDGGNRIIAATELDRVEVVLGSGGYEASMLVGERLGPIPAGSRFHAASGTLVWQPGPGFSGRYDFVFARAGDRVPVTILLGPRYAAPSQVEFTIDTPLTGSIAAGSVTIAGWAFDRGATRGTGVDAVHVWAYPVDGGEPIFLGAASYGSSRPDVAFALGPRVEESGFALSTATLPAATYDLAVFPHSTVSGLFAAAKVVRVTIN